MAFRLPRTKDLDLYGAEMKKLKKLRKKQRASLQVLGLKGQASVVKKRRPFSAPRHRNSNITHFASATDLRSIPGTNTIPDLSSYTTPAKRKNIGPIYPSRYGVDEELSHRLNTSMKREIETMISDQYNKLKASHPTFSPKQRIDERERQNLAGMKNTKLKYRSNGVDVAVALSEAATLCLQRPPGEDNQAITKGPNAKWWPNTRRVALCVATLEKLCRHPRLSVEEQKQLDIVVDTVKSGLYSNRFFGPPPKETVLNKSNSTEPIDMEPQFYFDLCKHLESTNDHLVSTSENLKANLEKEREQVEIYKQLLKESQEKVASLRGELEDHDKRNLILNKRVVYMQTSASDALDEYNKLNAMYVDLDGRFSVTASKANKLDKELAGLHKMYNGVSAELSQALKACGQLESKLKVLEPLPNELRSSQIEAATLRSENDDYKMKISMLEQQLSSQTDQIKSLKRRSSMMRRGSSMGSMVNLLKKM